MKKSNKLLHNFGSNIWTVIWLSVLCTHSSHLFTWSVSMHYLCFNASLYIGYCLADSYVLCLCYVLCALADSYVLCLRSLVWVSLLPLFASVSAEVGELHTVVSHGSQRLALTLPLYHCSYTSGKSKNIQWSNVHNDLFLIVYIKCNMHVQRYHIR